MTKLKHQYYNLKNTMGISIALAKSQFWTRGAGSFLGVIWYMVDPLVMFVIFVLARGVVGKGVPHYPIYLFIGLMMFNFFRKTTSEATKAIRSNSNLIKAIRTKPESFVIAIIISALFAHAFELVLLAGLIIFYGVPIVQLAGYLLVFTALTLLSLGVAFFTATIGTYFNDFANIWGLLTRILWFATPIFYSANSSFHLM